ncbi:hypothetical protein AYI68_g1298 [Smittium mucronatum]|uniref:Uncharacterized protein n=1 Tax=Smittium mucronatum TaxID=133383 RepID=A0A1R0H5S9_9FUNG|nr:hypothetical protein AYI68_g1298 [Smittium mucronatum]
MPEQTTPTIGCTNSVSKEPLDEKSHFCTIDLEMRCFGSQMESPLCITCGMNHFYPLIDADFEQLLGGMNVDFFNGNQGNINIGHENGTEWPTGDERVKKESPSSIIQHFPLTLSGSKL